MKKEVDQNTKNKNKNKREKKRMQKREKEKIENKTKWKLSLDGKFLVFSFHEYVQLNNVLRTNTIFYSKLRETNTKPITKIIHINIYERFVPHPK